MLRRWLHDRGGATAIEYALIASIMAIGCVAGITAVGSGTNGIWAVVGTAFNTHIR